jgi:hypothetical protein
MAVVMVGKHANPWRAELGECRADELGRDAIVLGAGKMDLDDAADAESLTKAGPTRRLADSQALATEPGVAVGDLLRGKVEAATRPAQNGGC